MQFTPSTLTLNPTTPTKINDPYTVESTLQPSNEVGDGGLGVRAEFVTANVVSLVIYDSG